MLDLEAEALESGLDFSPLDLPSLYPGDIGSGDMHEVLFVDLWDLLLISVCDFCLWPRLGLLGARTIPLGEASLRWRPERIIAVLGDKSLVMFLIAEL